MSYFSRYQPLEFDGTTIFVDPLQPDWFIASEQATAAISAELEQQPLALDQAQSYAFAQLQERFSHQQQTPLRGRAEVKQLAELKECWLHITNRCNMQCSHCLFASGDGDAAELPYEDLCAAVDQAYALGCRIFYFTGGEPLIYPRFSEICERILQDAACHIVILTNGRALSSLDSWLSRQDRTRLHFQISIDGLRENHEALRGAGSFAELELTLHQLRQTGLNATLSMSVNRNNVQEMVEVVRFAAEHGISNLHFMWLFIKGKAEQSLFVPPQEIFRHACAAYELAIKLGVTIDNFDIMKSQVFNFPGIRMDLSNSCWESLTVGPDGNIYPSPASVYESSLCCGRLADGLRRVWTESPLMEQIRALSVVNCNSLADDPLRFLIGGGDLDHSYIYAGEFVGKDPYLPLYRQLALYLLSREAEQSAAAGATAIGLLARMGERIEECDESGSEVGLTHSNCVLSLSDRDGHASIRSFYSQAADEVNEDIVNPVHYETELIEHIPESSRVRSYGCGSPVMDCNLQAGETLVDLGSGTGVECFIAARQVGSTGQVYGIDMSDTMLARARSAARQVGENLGYANVEFKKGFLEQIPLPDDHCNVVISNCVINLSINKRRTFQEIFRVLKPGGRILISDIVTATDIPLHIRINEKLRGECIGGAMHENDLFGILSDFGFTEVRIVKRFLYREVKGYPFYSLTYEAIKPGPSTATTLIYRGPFAGVVTDSGQLISRGQTTRVQLAPHTRLSDDFMLLDDKGRVTNLEQEMSCCCLPDCNASTTPRPEVKSSHKSGCMICGKPIVILTEPKVLACQYCGQEKRVESCCEDGHFVCDQCHIHAAADIITKACLTTKEKDVIAIFKELRAHPDFPTHGPHHHPMIPGILLAAYRNNGGQISDEQIITGISRGILVPGASCSFFGVDGAAIGVGIAFSVIIEASPFKGETRQAVQKIVIRVAQKIAEQPFSRCCQRDCWTALKEAELIAAEMLEHPIPAQAPLQCEQFRNTDHCAGKRCPLFP